MQVSYKKQASIRFGNRAYMYLRKPLIDEVKKLQFKNKTISEIFLRVEAQEKNGKGFLKLYFSNTKIGGYFYVDVLRLRRLGIKRLGINNLNIFKEGAEYLVYHEYDTDREQHCWSVNF